jgi:guanylate kinase
MSERVVSPILLVVAAPSGAGKTTMGRHLIEATPRLERAITCTTRPPRPGEHDGADYHFLTAEEFERRVAAAEFLEHATVYGFQYGTLKSEVFDRLARERDVLLNVDVQGAEAIRGAALNDAVLRTVLVSVFLMPPSISELERRLTGRKQDAAEVIRRRLAVARAEMSHWRSFDYLVVSGAVADDFRAMQHILATEKLKSARIRRLLID